MISLIRYFLIIDCDFLNLSLNLAFELEVFDHFLLHFQKNFFALVQIFTKRITV